MVCAPLSLFPSASQAADYSRRVRVSARHCLRFVFSGTTVFSEERRNGVFARFAAGNGKDQRFQGVIKFGGIFLVEPIAVQVEKGQCGNCSRSFVAIDKGMVGNDRKRYAAAIA